jgi:hypothetical protein
MIVYTRDLLEQVSLLEAPSTCDSTSGGVPTPSGCQYNWACGDITPMTCHPLSGLLAASQMGHPDLQLPGSALAGLAVALVRLSPMSNRPRSLNPTRKFSQNFWTTLSPSLWLLGVTV